MSGKKKDYEAAKLVEGGFKLFIPAKKKKKKKIEIILNESG